MIRIIFEEQSMYRMTFILLVSMHSLCGVPKSQKPADKDPAKASKPTTQITDTEELTKQYYIIGKAPSHGKPPMFLEFHYDKPKK